MKEHKIKHEKPEKKTGRILIAAAIVFIAVLVVMSGITRAHLKPFSKNVMMNSITDFFIGENGQTMVDSGHTRLLILDDRESLNAVVSANSPGAPVDYFFSACVIGKDVYVLGCDCFNGDIYIETEKIMKYNLRGQYKGDVYSIKYNDDDYVTKAKCRELWDDFGKLNILHVDGDSVKIEKINQNRKPEKIHPKTIMQKSIGEDVVDAEYNPSTGAIVVKGKYGTIKAFDQLTGKETNDTDEKILFDDYEIPYSSRYMLHHVGYWLCVLIVIIALLILIVRAMKKGNNGSTLRTIAIIGAILITAGFFAVANINQQEEQYKRTGEVFSSQIATVFSRDYDDVAKGVEEVGAKKYCSVVENRSRIDELQGTIQELTHSWGKETGFYTTIFHVEGKGKFVVLAQSDPENEAGGKVKAIAAPDELEKMISEGNYPEYKDGLVYHMDLLKDSENQTEFVVSVGMKKQNLDKILWVRIFETFILLTALIVAIWMLAAVIGILKESLAQYRKEKESGLPDAAVNLSGMHSFIVNTTLLLDVIVLVYAVKSISEGAPTSHIATRTAILLTIYSVGQILGTAAQPKLTKAVGVRSVEIISLIISAVSYIGMGVAIVTKSMLLLAVGKALTGFFMSGVVYMCAAGVPLYARGTERREEALNKTDKSTIAASVIATLIGGYLAQYVGFKYLYFVAAVLCLLIVPIAVVIFRNKEMVIQPRTELEETERKAPVNWKFFMQPKILLFFICVILTFRLTGGYSTYLFPLYSATAGVSAVLLSNLSVFAKSISFATEKPLTRLAGKLGPVQSMLCAEFAVALMLICSFASPNIYWAMLILIIEAVMSRVMRVGSMSYLTREAEEDGYNLNSIQTGNFVIQSLIQTVQPAILSMFAALGTAYANAALGIACALLLDIFVIRVLRKKR